MIKANDIKKLKELLSKKKNIVITTHLNPDGDAMGSSLGLYNFLVKLKHNVTVVTPNDWPDFLAWLPGANKAVDAKAFPKKAHTLIQKADIVFCLDFNVLYRIDQLETIVGNSKAFKILIDHHLQPGTFPDITYSDTSASSTCQMVFEFIEAIGQKKLVDKKIATCLYTGIMTDTASLRFESATPITYRIAAELIEAGAPKTTIHENVYDTFSENKMKLLGYSISSKLSALHELKTAFISLSAAELSHYNYQKGDTEGIVNYALSIKGIKFAAIFIERDDEIKMSFRSKGTFDVNTFARKHFGGGGHKNAAGAQSDLTLDETISKFIALLGDYKTELSKK